jgi:hypothetical protein
MKGEKVRSLEAGKLGSREAGKQNHSRHPVSKILGSVISGKIFALSLKARLQPFTFSL